MLNLEIRTNNPALTFHLEAYLTATERQSDPSTPIKEWLELDIQREVALTQIALIKGFITHCPIDGLLPTKVWSQTIEFIQEIKNL
ncbi:MAG: hypothetical protein ACKPCM_18780 [Pseudanabaena sp.]